MTRPVTIGFDADDTLWHNEDHFHEVEQEFADAMTPWAERSSALELLGETERRNLKIFGYGVKGFTISMIEAAVELSSGAVPAPVLQTLIEHGKALHTRPPRLLDDVEAVLDTLSAEHELLLVTKGDLHHQQGKVGESGLADRFRHVEVVAEKDPATYLRVLGRQGIAPEEFVMVGNSLRSDVLPVLEIGGVGVHIPYSVTWAHELAEVTDAVRATGRFHELGSITGLPGLIAESGWRPRRSGPGRSVG
jgi:putative hydrolase of the HAD superfamily